MVEFSEQRPDFRPRTAQSAASVYRLLAPVPERMLKLTCQHDGSEGLFKFLYRVAMRQHRLDSFRLWPPEVTGHVPTVCLRQPCNGRRDACRHGHAQKNRQGRKTIAGSRDAAKL